MNEKGFSTIGTEGKARAGVLHTRRGDVQTPLFMTVGTRGAVKAGVSAEDVTAVGGPMMLCNTYHLHLRPGAEAVSHMGGLHGMMNYDGPILTDSGGFQVFSIQDKKITDDGVFFTSHIDGTRFFMDAESSMQIQHALGADIIMAFDECPPNVPDRKIITRAVRRTTEWAKRSIDEHKRIQNGAQLFGIVQGGSFADLREKSLHELQNLPFDGFALGGLAVGEPDYEMYKVLDQLIPKLPEEKAKYLMGVGTPTNLLEAISRGVDMFDCVMPMRNARHAVAFTWAGKMRMRNECYADDLRPLDPETILSPANKYSRAYLRHLLTVGEELGKRLLTLHNIAFYQQLMKESRAHIVAGTFGPWKDKLVQRWAESE